MLGQDVLVTPVKCQMHKQLTEHCPELERLRERQLLKFLLREKNTC